MSSGVPTTPLRVHTEGLSLAQQPSCCGALAGRGEAREIEASTSVRCPCTRRAAPLACLAPVSLGSDAGKAVGGRGWQGPGTGAPSSPVLEPSFSHSENKSVTHMAGEKPALGRSLSRDGQGPPLPHGTGRLGRDQATCLAGVPAKGSVLGSSRSARDCPPALGLPSWHQERLLPPAISLS